MAGVRMVSRNASRTVGERLFRLGRCGKSCGGTVGAPTSNHTTRAHRQSSPLPPSTPRVSASIPSPHPPDRARSHPLVTTRARVDKPTSNQSNPRSPSRSRAPSGFLGGTRVVGGACTDARARTPRRPPRLVAIVAVVVAIVVAIVAVAVVVVALSGTIDDPAGEASVGRVRSDAWVVCAVSHDSSCVLRRYKEVIVRSEGV